MPDPIYIEAALQTLPDEAFQIVEPSDGLPYSEAELVDRLNDVGAILIAQHAGWETLHELSPLRMLQTRDAVMDAVKVLASLTNMVEERAKRRI